VTDTLGMLRQLGFARSLLMGIKSFGLLIAVSQSGRSKPPTTGV
jgi:hypothetical protein